MTTRINTPLSIAEERETYLRDDGTTFTREDIYVKLSVTFRDTMLKRLKGPKLSVLLCIALHCNRDMAAWPSTKQIQEETGYSNRAVITAIEQLCGMGLLTKRQHKNGGEYDNNRYEVQDFFSMGKGESDVVNESHEVMNDVHKGYEPSSQGVMNYVHTKKIPYKKDIADDVPSSEPPPTTPNDEMPASALVGKKKERKSRITDERGQSVAIQSIRKLKEGKYPPKAMWDTLIAALGEQPDEARLAACYQEWVARGYNLNSWKWVTDWYAQGGVLTLPRSNGYAARPLAAVGTDNNGHETRGKMEAW